MDGLTTVAVEREDGFGVGVDQLTVRGDVGVAGAHQPVPAGEDVWLHLRVPHTSDDS